MVATTLFHVLSVEAVLASSPHPELRRILVIENEDEVRLIGKVSSWHLKQIAQESVRPAICGRRLKNFIDVVSNS
jgi:hypothetical protein